MIDLALVEISTHPSTDKTTMYEETTAYTDKKPSKVSTIDYQSTTEYESTTTDYEESTTTGYEESTTTGYEESTTTDYDKSSSTEYTTTTKSQDLTYTPTKYDDMEVASAKPSQGKLFAHVMYATINQ